MLLSSPQMFNEKQIIIKKWICNQAMQEAALPFKWIHSYIYIDTNTYQMNDFYGNIIRLDTFKSDK